MLPLYGKYAFHTKECGRVDPNLDEAPVEFGWVVFLAKIASALIWLVANTIAAAVLASSQSAYWERAFAGGDLMVAAIICIGLSCSQLRRSDEFNRDLLAILVNSGTLWVVLCCPCLFAGSLSRVP